MSRENLEQFRAYHDEIARAGREDFDAEATIARMAAFWDQDVEYDMSKSPWLDIGGIDPGSRCLRASSA